jgi:hypothetical protein
MHRMSYDDSVLVPQVLRCTNLLTCRGMSDVSSTKSGKTVFLPCWVCNMFL